MNRPNQCIIPLLSFRGLKPVWATEKVKSGGGQFRVPTTVCSVETLVQVFFAPGSESNKQRFHRLIKAIFGLPGPRFTYSEDWLGLNPARPLARKSRIR